MFDHGWNARPVLRYGLIGPDTQGAQVRVLTALGSRRRPRGVPSLTVADIDKALFYYRRFFEFEAITSDENSALVRGNGATLRLRRTPSEGDGTRAELPPPDALILVRQPETLRRRLDDWGAHLVPSAELGPAWEGMYGIRDCYGNVIAIGPTGGIWTPARWIVEPLDALKRRWRQGQTNRMEAQRLEAFRRFYDALPDHDDIYYLHVNGGLLHWLIKTASYVPEDVNLVVLGSDLAPAEQAWVAEHLHRPFHHVDLRLDDAGALEFLFTVNRRNFGWLGLGCLVLNGDLFRQLARIGADTAMNCAWSWESGFGFPIANSYFFFVAAHAAQRVRAIGVGPGTYSYHRFNRQVENRRCYSRTPPREAVRMLSGRLPSDDRGRPAVPGGMPAFEPTVLYQLVAGALGLKINRVRDLSGFNHVRGGDIQDDGSDELFYVSGLTRADVVEEFSGFFHDAGIRLLYAIAEFVTLAPTADRLPAQYGQRLRQVASELDRLGLPPNMVADACRQHLVDVRGLSSSAADAVLGSPRVRSS
jgi:hypothetical protein